MKTFTADKNCTLRDFTDCVYPQASFCFARLLKERQIKINGVRADKNAVLIKGDEVTYYLTAKEQSVLSHTVVYEDENIAVLDKFSGVSTEGLLSELNFGGKYFAVHRLDRNTCGVIAFAKTARAESALLKALKEKQVKKTYLAVCRDNFKTDAGSITAYIKKEEKLSKVSVYFSPEEGAKTAVTNFRVLERARGLALVEIDLKTGRTHQIRATFAKLGCPVLGDGKYGDSLLNKSQNATRQRLLARSLRFLSLEEPLIYLNGREFFSSQILTLP